jgi:DNA-binding XRE family transcriptional regulator
VGFTFLEIMNKYQNITRNYILEFRARKNVSQIDLALAVQRDPSTITKWENQTNQPTATSAIRLLDFFKCNFEELFENTKEESQGKESNSIDLP